MNILLRWCKCPWYGLFFGEHIACYIHETKLNVDALKTVI